MLVRGGEGGKEWEEVGSGDVLFWSLPADASMRPY